MSPVEINPNQKDVAKKESTAVTNPTPGSVPRGFEDPIDRNDLVIPRAKMLQALSPEVIDDKMEPGLIINSLTKQALPAEFIPCFFFAQWIRFNPRKPKDEDFNSNYPAGEIIWRSNNPHDARVINEGKWRGDKPPLATKFLDFFCLFEGQGMPIIVSFCNTSFTAGKQLLSLAKFSGGDMFSKRYALTTKSRTNEIGTFFVLDVKCAGQTDEAQYRQAEAWYKEFRAKDLEVHIEQPEGEGKDVPF